MPRGVYKRKKAASVSDTKVEMPTLVMAKKLQKAIVEHIRNGGDIGDVELAALNLVKVLLE